MNKATTLIWYCKTPRGWRRFPVIEEKGRVKVGHVLDHGAEAHYPQGRFELRQYKGRRLVYTAVKTTDPLMAVIERRKQARVALIRGGVEESRKLLRKAATLYVADCINRKAMVAAKQARIVTEAFLHVCNATYVDAVNAEDVFRFHKALRAKGNSERTIANKHQRLKTWLRWCKVDTAFLPPAPSYEEGLPTIYEPEEVGAIRRAAVDAGDGQMLMCIDLCLKLGLREQEAMHAEWADIRTTSREFRVQGKIRKEWRFAVKDKEQRDVPVPVDLLQSLLAWQGLHPDSVLILGNKQGLPEGHLLRKLKTLARHAGLNCGRCEGCQRKGSFAECEEWTLHRFRRTYVTGLLRNGCDARTVQAFAGHSDLETTLRYLRPASTVQSQDLVNSIRWG
jgi:integrase